MQVEILFDRDIYEKFILSYLASARKYLWIATANIKDLYIEYLGKYRPFLYLLSLLVKKGVEIRIIYAKEPGPHFQQEMDKYPLLWDGIEQMVCPRMHMKMILVDGRILYVGSANLTGAGVGAKSERRRNFEFGLVSQDREFIEPFMIKFDALWIGNYCESCERKSLCGEHPFI